MKILLFNAGSSSLKFSLLESEGERTLAEGRADWARETTQYAFRAADDPSRDRREAVSWRGYGEAVQRALNDLTNAGAWHDRSEPAAVGHRIVHGGDFTGSTRITDDVKAQLTALEDLAPLHNPPSLETLAAAQQALPQTQHIACFDTAFHTTLPPHAYSYSVPRQWTEEWGIRRYGFHGLSHAWCARRGAQMLQPREGPGSSSSELRLVICHLGHGCSASAVLGGECIDTTMGFTPLDGLMMATRSGSLDPGIVLYVQQKHGLSADEVDNILYRESGLFGVSGLSADMRDILQAANDGHQRARLALDIYVHRLRQTIGALTATLGGLDALIFTGGVGEHPPEVRERTCGRLECLGVQLDRQANAAAGPDADIAAQGWAARILVIAAREDLTMLQQVVQLMPETGV